MGEDVSGLGLFALPKWLFKTDCSALRGFMLRTSWESLTSSEELLCPLLAGGLGDGFPLSEKAGLNFPLIVSFSSLTQSASSFEEEESSSWQSLSSFSNRSNLLLWLSLLSDAPPLSFWCPNCDVPGNFLVREVPERTYPWVRWLCACGWDSAWAGWEEKRKRRQSWSPLIAGRPHECWGKRSSWGSLFELYWLPKPPCLLKTWECHCLHWTPAQGLLLASTGTWNLRQWTSGPPHLVCLPCLHFCQLCLVTYPWE